MKWVARCSGGGKSPWSVHRESQENYLVANFDGFFSRRLTMRQMPGPTIATFDSRRNV
ncbi:hypothetical protein [Arenimonas alkanexedens]